MSAHRLRSWSALCSALLLCGAFDAAAFDDAPVLTVAAVTGKAEVEHLGERHRLQVGAWVDERDVLHLDDDGHLVLRLAQGGVLELGPLAELSVEKLPSAAVRGDRKSIFNLAHGYLRIAWAPPADVAAPLFLYFSGQRASLAAGEYFFESVPNAARVCVASGMLSAIPLAGSLPHTLVPAACYRLINGAEPESIARDAAAWASMRRNFSLNAPTSPEAELAAEDPSAHGGPVAAPTPIADAVRPPRAESAARTTIAAAAPAVSTAPMVAMPSGSWAINIASYAEAAPADKQARELQAGGYNASVQPVQIDGRPWYRVQLRGFDSSEAAHAQMQALKTKSGYANVWVVRAP